MKNRIVIIVILITCISAGTSALAVSVTNSNPNIRLPSGYITMTAQYGVSSWFNMNISDIPSGFDISNGNYPGWCIQKSIYMTRGVAHTVTMNSSYDPNMPDTFSNANWDKINYLINHKQGSRDSIQSVIWYYFNDESYPSDPDAQTMIADANANGSGFIPKPGELVAILVEGVPRIQRSFLELTCPEPHPWDNNTGNEIKNHAPTADATAGQPYDGFVGMELTLDGSLSYDRDGVIVSYYWNFGDGTNGSGEVTPHIYHYPGKYKVSLTVTDDDGAKNTYTFSVKIVWANYPPNIPIVTGPESGQRNTTYEYIAVSTDVENESLQYTFEWGDGNITTTDFLSNGTATTQTHNWTSAGCYSLKVKAFDNTTDSDPAILNVLIDACFTGDLGYIVDTNDDGIYDVFHGNATGIETKAGYSNGDYLLDTNGDGAWDFKYDPLSNTILEYNKGSSSDLLNSYTIGIAVAIVIAIIILVLFFVLNKSKKDDSSS